MYVYINTIFCSWMMVRLVVLQFHPTRGFSNPSHWNQNNAVSSPNPSTESMRISIPAIGAPAFSIPRDTPED